ncbi:hypothetical protein L228DRAFT_17256 [Xylona heveae TC161]|uniref:Uncharacterized protein n=1 Tax=Xylona heveae (strain CBS 132557 / TC161) TaxID=1328760 RepID=A0A165JWT8_XYLHT|nr:hypothetical protein L228DRAFT_17256 [Xylona heveae TC161]KZF26721.1 hypothetical protein L228DRAFT_17256 [Xylona heveae TC161]
MREVWVSITHPSNFLFDFFFLSSLSKSLTPYFLHSINLFGTVFAFFFFISPPPKRYGFYSKKRIIFFLGGLTYMNVSIRKEFPLPTYK